MIAYITGTIIDILETSVIVETGGLGYQVFLPAPKLQQLKAGAPVTFYLHHHIREDNQQLFGFSSKQEKELFAKMIHHVSGVGPKIALAAMGAASHADLIRAIQLEDVTVFKGIPGVGPKTAKRIVLELKSKVEWDDTIQASANSESSVRQDVYLALEQLGYQAPQIRDAISDLEESLALEEAMKQALKNLQK